MNRLLIAIIVIAFVLRVVGIGYGLPMFLVGDEVSITGAALKMLELKTFIPALDPGAFRLLYYPPLISYVYLVFIVPVLAVWYVVGGMSVDSLKIAVTFDPTVVWLTTRLVTAALGTLTVLIIYHIGRRLFGQISGLFGAALLATSFLAVQLSHFSRHWMPATFFTYLVIGLGLLLFQDNRRKVYILAGLLAGCAFGASYITAIAVAVVFMAHLLARNEPVFRRIFHRDIIAFGVSFLTIASVFGFLNYPELHRIVVGEDSGLHAAKTIPGLFAALWTSLAAFFTYEPILVVVGGLGFIVLCVGQRRLAALFAAFPLLYWVVLYYFFHFEPRYNILLVPWFCLLAGVSLKTIWDLPFSKSAQSVLIAVILAVPLTVASYYDYLIVVPDTREDAREWIEQNLASDTPILLYASALDLNPSIRAVELLSANFPYLLRTRDNLIAELPGDKRPRPGYTFINYKNLLPQDREMSRFADFTHFVVEYVDPLEVDPQYIGIMKSAKLIKRFPPQPLREYLQDVNGNFEESVFNIFSIRQLGPVVEVYQR